MRGAVIGLLLVAACTTPPGPPSDDVDAGTDAAIDATPGPLDGEWWAEWMCIEGCGEPPGRPALTRSRQLDIDHGQLAFSDFECADCSAHHEGAIDGPCVAVAAGDESLMERDLYRLCLIDGAHIGAVVEWRATFAPEPTNRTTWQLSGWPRGQ
jgi:hypothetical protein